MVVATIAQSVPSRSRSVRAGPGRSRAVCALHGCLALVLALAGCGREPSPNNDEAAIAHVGDTPVSLAELNLHLSVNLLADESAEDGNEAHVARVKSRLLDALLEENLLLAEAERRGIEVDESEIETRVEAAAAERGSRRPSLPAERLRALTRRRVMIGKLEAVLARDLPQVTEDEVQAYIEANREGLDPGRRVRLRALRFDSAETAAQVDSAIRERRMSFAHALVTHETDPGQGVPLDLTWANLPVALRDALEGLQPGEVTRPVEFHGEIYLFQLETPPDDPAADQARLTRRARERLEDERRRRARESFLEELRERTPLQVHPEHLPFAYVPDEETGPGPLSSPEVQ